MKEREGSCTSFVVDLCVTKLKVGGSFGLLAHTAPRTRSTCTLIIHTHQEKQVFYNFNRDDIDFESACFEKLENSLCSLQYIESVIYNIRLDLESCDEPA